MRRVFVFSCAILWVFSTAGLSYATVILSPTTVIQNTAGDVTPSHSTTNTINQSGLSATFTSGVTDFDVYFGTPVVHSVRALDEWWAYPDSGTVDYDLGDSYIIDRIALWNEEVNGLVSVGVYTDIAADFSTALFHGTFIPTDNPYGVEYLADIFSLTEARARYVRLVMAAATGETFPYESNLSMGEIAFSVASIPDPSAVFLLGSACLIGCTGLRRKYKK